MFTLTVLAYGADGVGIISPTLKIKILRLREVKWFTQSHTTCKNRASSQTGLLTLNLMFFLLACSASYVFLSLLLTKKVYFGQVFKAILMVCIQVLLTWSRQHGNEQLLNQDTACPLRTPGLLNISVKWFHPALFV